MEEETVIIQQEPEFPVKWKGKTVKNGKQTIQITESRDPMTGQPIFLHVELTK